MMVLTLGDLGTFPLLVLPLKEFEVQISLSLQQQLASVPLLHLCLVLVLSLYAAVGPPIAYFQPTFWLHGAHSHGLSFRSCR